MPVEQPDQLHGQFSVLAADENPLPVHGGRLRVCVVAVTLHAKGVPGVQSEDRQRELTEMLTGPEAWPAVVGLETGWLEDLWRRLDDGATVLQDDFTERFEGVFNTRAAESLGPMDTSGVFG